VRLLDRSDDLFLCSIESGLSSLTLHRVIEYSTDVILAKLIDSFYALRDALAATKMGKDRIPNYTLDREPELERNLYQTNCSCRHPGVVDQAENKMSLSQRDIGSVFKGNGGILKRNIGCCIHKFRRLNIARKSGKHVNTQLVLMSF
jgi:hypothetical protein